MTADEHARLRPCRMMLRHYMLTVCGRRPHEQKMVHGVLACATSCVHIRTRVSRYCVYACRVRLGPAGYRGCGYK